MKGLVDCKVFIFNAPPRSGKDISVYMLHEYLSRQGCNVEKMAFKDKLFEMTATVVGETLDEFKRGYDSDLKTMLPHKDYGLPCNNVVKWWKDYPLYYFQDELKSKREMLQWTSEEFVKPHLGRDYFGKQVASRISWQDFVLISDGGFTEEIESVIERVGVRNVTIVQLKRDTGNTAFDTRKMLTREDFHESMCPQFVEVDNNGTLDELKDKLIEILK